MTEKYFLIWKFVPNNDVPNLVEWNRFETESELLDEVNDLLTSVIDTGQELVILFSGVLDAEITFVPIEVVTRMKVNRIAVL